MLIVVQLNAILGEVDALVGVPDVKKAMYSLVDTMLRNWDREKSALPTEGIFLNRVFVGNPGTGKTTVAKLYARLLCATNMLSKDEVMLRSASDFMGQAVGESAQKTKDILKLAEGKALLIDEAYALFDGASKSSGNASYGQPLFHHSMVQSHWSLHATRLTGAGNKAGALSGDDPSVGLSAGIRQDGR